MKKVYTFFLLVFAAASSTAQIDCNSWTRLNNRFAAVTTGDLDVTGNQVTVEALFVMTGPSVDIVSKHLGGNDLNYLLRPVRAEVATTTSGFVTTNQGAGTCNDVLDLNKIYHAALVYNGSSLKFYRNGALISSVPCFGNLKTNNWDMAIGEHAPVVTPILNGLPNPDYQNANENQGYYDESFRGYINEVKVWNVARTQEQLRQYMYTPLPDPGTQTGLMGYWTLDNLQNKQGNAAYDGRIEGLATIAQTSVTCSFIADSCGVVLPVKIAAFNAAAVDNTVRLSWQTEEELNIKDYIIQRSETADFSSYLVVGVVNAYGNSRSNSYSFADEAIPAANKTFYYRLLVRETNGKGTFSQVKAVKVLNKEKLAVDIYPNPAKDELVKIRFSVPPSFVSITIFNHLGQIVNSQKPVPVPGVAMSINMAGYSAGTYFIGICTGNEKIVRKLVKL